MEPVKTTESNLETGAARGQRVAPCCANLGKFFEDMRFIKLHHLGLGDIRLTIDQQESIAKEQEMFLERLKTAFNYIAHEVEDNPEDSIRDILNDAFLNCNLPFISDDDYIISDFDWKA